MSKNGHNFLTSIKRYIKEGDTFGKPIRLNFDQHGDTFNTFPGGVISMLIRIILILYGGLLLSYLYLDSNDLFISFK